jgi:SAM-dependent methyltransferase
VGPGGGYPIAQGIASFVDESASNTQTVRSFAQKWSAHKYYRKQTGSFYTGWFLKRYGFLNLPRLRECLSGARFVLDAGTGSGRDAATFAKHSDATVFAVDITRQAVEVAKRDVDHPRVCFVHADINHLPFPDEFFDFINCDQVIHHTPDPRASFDALRRKLKTGGQVCCYVYRKKAAIREFTDDYVRERIRELPVKEALAVCSGITRLGQTLAELDVMIDVEEDIPVLGIRKGSLDLQRFFHWNILKCFWNREFDFFTNNIINFDWYHPEQCHRFEPEAFRSWFRDGWKIEAWDVQEAGLSCRARKT